MKKKLTIITLIVLLCSMCTYAVAAAWVIAVSPQSFTPEARSFPVHYRYSFNAGDGTFDKPEGPSAVAAEAEGSLSEDGKTYYSPEHVTESGETVTLDADGADMPGNSPNRLAYDFAGWSAETATNDNKTIDKDHKEDLNFYLSPQSELECTIDLTALWDAIDYMVKFDNKDKGGEKPDSKVVTIEEENNTLELDQLTEPGYTFEGWEFDYSNGYETAKKEYTKDNTPGEDDVITFTFDEEIAEILGATHEMTLNAMWEAIYYSVTYEGGIEGSGITGDKVKNLPTDETKYNIGNSVTISDQEPSRTGFKFTGWKVKDDESDTTIYKNGTVHSNYTMKDKDVTFVAQWEAIEYTVKFEQEFETEAGGKNTVAAGENQTVSLLSPNVTLDKTAVDGFTIGGWTVTIEDKENGDAYKLDNTNTQFTLGVEYISNHGLGEGDTLLITTNYKIDKIKATVVVVTDGTAEEKTYQFEYTIETENIIDKLPEELKTMLGKRVGYKFGGWFYDAECKEQIDGASTATATISGKTLYDHFKGKTSNQTIYASRNALTYQTTFKTIPENKSATDMPTSGNISLKEPSLELGTPKLTGYGFEKWTITVQGKDVTNSYINNQNFTLTEDFITSTNINENETITFTAVFNASEFTLEYKDGLEGTSTTIEGDTVTNMPQGGSHKTDEKFQLPQQTPERVGFKFTGWKSNVGENQTYQPGGEFIMPAENVTLTAQWEAIEYTIKFENNGHGETIQEKKIKLPEAHLSTNQFPKLTEIGYIFGGWSIGGTEKTYNQLTRDLIIAVNTPLNNNENTVITLTAKWSTIAYTIHFEDKKLHKQNSDMTVNLNTPDNEKDFPVLSEPGYRFKFWTVKEEGGEGYYYLTEALIKEAGKESDKDSPVKITVYAQWELITYTVHFDNNGHGTKPQDTTVTIESPDVTLTQLSETGYTFEGWQFKGKTYKQEGSPFQLTKEIIGQFDNNETNTKAFTLKAQWKENAYTVEYKDGVKSGEAGTTVTGMPSDNNQTYKINDTVTVSETVPSRKGYEFTGWQLEDGKTYRGTGSSGSTSFVVDADLLTKHGDDMKFTLTAQWTAKEYEVKFEKGNIDAEVPNLPRNQKIKVGESVTPETPSVASHKFTGWTLKVNDKVTQFSVKFTLSQNEIDSSNNVTIVFTANWLMFIRIPDDPISINYNSALLKENELTDAIKKGIPIKNNSSKDLTEEERKFIELKINSIEGYKTVATNGQKEVYGSTFKVSIGATITEEGKAKYLFSGGITSTSLDLIVKYNTVTISSHSGSYYTIEDALNTAGSGDTITVIAHTAFTTKTVAEKAEYSDDYYTVKTGVRLFLPYDGKSGENTTVANSGTLAFDSPSTYMKLELILPANIVLTNNGTITIGGRTSGGGGSKAASGQTAADYAQINLGASAGIQSYGDINAYGFIVEENKGNNSFVNMNKGNILMPFIVIEHRGGNIFSSIYTKSASVFNRFFLQNVTAKLTVNYGAFVIGLANLYANSHDNITSIGLVGNKSTDLIYFTNRSSNVEIKYDKETKVTDLKIFGSFKLNSMKLDAAGASVSTEKVLFPISWYWNVSLFSAKAGGTATVEAPVQGFKLLPGAKLTIGKGVTVNAKDIAVYETFSDVAIGTPSVYETKSAAVLTVNGVLNVTAIGGPVTADEDGGVLAVTNATTKSSEVTSNTGVTETSYTLKLRHNNSGSVEEAPTNATAGTYESANKGWKTADTSQKYTITYKYIFDGTEKSDITVTNNNATEYTVKDTINLSDASANDWVFIGWYDDSSCSEEHHIMVIQGSRKENITVYGLFKQVNSYIFDYNTNKSDITINSDKVLAEKLSEFDIGAHDAEIGIYDNDASKQQYFDGWFMDSEFNTPFSIEAVKKEGEGINKHIALYAKWTNKQKLTAKITEVNVTINGTIYSKNTTLYYKAGTVITIILAPIDGILSDGSINSATITGAQWSGKHDDRQGNYSLTMPAGDVTITIKGEEGCFAAGTLVTLKDGTQKNVEDLVMGVDELLVFDHMTGKFTSTNLFFVMHRGAKQCRTVKLYFSDGTMVHVFFEHGFFDVDSNEYEQISPENAAEYIGHRFYSVTDGTRKIVELVSFEASIEYAECYSIYTGIYVNHIINGMLAVSDALEGLYNVFELDENMKYDEAKMQADIEKYGLFTYEEWSDYCTEEEFYLCNVQYLKVALGKGLVTMEQIYHYFNDFLAMFH